VALCPNCHRKMHIVDDPKDRELLRLHAQEAPLPTT
jgi:predicted HNH restriction endonuclease